MKIGTQARADRRVLFSAALIGSGLGLGLGATYMAAGMAQAMTDHGRAAQIVQAADSAFSDSGLRQGVAFAPTAPEARLKSARELDCLTQAVYFEARGETPRGQAAVATVVLNRVKNPAFPKTVCAVVYQGAARNSGCQFSFACDGSMRRGREMAAWSRARHVAARALSGVVLAEVGKATHFHTTGVAPIWGPRMLRVAQVGLHVFYRFNPHAPVGVEPERAVFVSLPGKTSADQIRLADATVTEKVEATLAVPPPAQPAPQAKPEAVLSKASDVAVSPPKPADAIGS